jgi:hypothetical protein
MGRISSGLFYIGVAGSRPREVHTPITDAASLQCACGIAPVTKQSGKKRHVHRRYRCSEFFKQSFHEWVGESRFFSGWARTYYDRKCAGSIASRIFICGVSWIIRPAPKRLEPPRATPAPEAISACCRNSAST